MIDRWQHIVLILGLALLAVLGLAVTPEHAWDKVGNGLALVVADPIGAVGGAVALGSTIGAMLAAYRRALKTPVPEPKRRERETDPAPPEPTE